MRKTSKVLISVAIAIVLTICMSASVYASLDSTMGTCIHAYDNVDYSCNIEKSTYGVGVAMHRSTQGYNSCNLMVEAQVLLSPNTTVYKYGYSQISDEGYYVDSYFGFDKICFAAACYYYVDGNYIGGCY